MSDKELTILKPRLSPWDNVAYRYPRREKLFGALLGAKVTHILPAKSLPLLVTAAFTMKLRLQYNGVMYDTDADSSQFPNTPDKDIFPSAMTTFSTGMTSV